LPDRRPRFCIFTIDASKLSNARPVLIFKVIEAHLAITYIESLCTVTHCNHTISAVFVMADVKDITPTLERLDDQIDDLEDALEPLLENLEELSSQLPLLDKAKLFSLTAYAIESMLFCTYLRTFRITVLSLETDNISSIVKDRRQ
jgi:hypothetical protein